MTAYGRCPVSAVSKAALCSCNTTRCSFRLRVQSLGVPFGWELAFRVWGLEFRVWAFEFRVGGLEFRAWEFGFGLQGFQLLVFFSLEGVGLLGFGYVRVKDLWLRASTPGAGAVATRVCFCNRVRPKN